jgi:hypothetical protein
VGHLPHTVRGGATSAQSSGLTILAVLSAATEHHRGRPSQRTCSGAVPVEIARAWHEGRFVTAMTWTADRGSMSRPIPRSQGDQVTTASGGGERSDHLETNT